MSLFDIISSPNIGPIETLTICCVADSTSIEVHCELSNLMAYGHAFFIIGTIQRTRHGGDIPHGG